MTGQFVKTVMLALHRGYDTAEMAILWKVPEADVYRALVIGRELERKAAC